MLEVSVIICTHNPKVEYLKRAVEAIKLQTLPQDKWELLIIDNNSSTSVKELPGINWPVSVRHLFEVNVGLISARIKGIKEAKAELLVFVDDDNCLKADYLEILIKNMQSMAVLGVLGAGKIFPEFEKPPSKEEILFLRSLAIRNEERAHFSNAVSYHLAIPFGAGLSIRKSIALSYAESCKSRPFAETLDRKGEVLLSGGDIDLALWACSKGNLAGVLPELEITHLISKERIEPKYLIKIAAGHAASGIILAHLWKFNTCPPNSWLNFLRFLKKYMKSSGLSRKILLAEFKAEREAKHILKKQLDKREYTVRIKNAFA